MVWRDGVGTAEVETVTCPVLALTPEVQEVLGWFDRTHELTGGMGVAWWRIHTLPRTGGLDGQDARLMSALDWMRDIENTVLVETRREREGQADRGERRRRRG